jgi:hypothetical protein
LIEDRSQVLSTPTAVRPELLIAVQAQAAKHSAGSDTTQDSVHATATALATQVQQLYVITSHIAKLTDIFKGKCSTNSVLSHSSG